MRIIRIPKSVMAQFVSVHGALLSYATISNGPTGRALGPETELNNEYLIDGTNLWPRLNENPLSLHLDCIRASRLAPHFVFIYRARLGRNFHT